MTKTLHRHYKSHGKERRKRCVFRRLQKTGRDGADVTWRGRSLQVYEWRRPGEFFTSLWGRKNCTLFIIFWQFLAYRYWSKVATKLQQNCPPLLMTVLTVPCEKTSQLVHKSSNVSFKSHEIRAYGETHSKCSMSLFLRHALKQYHHWSMKICSLLITSQSDAASAHWRSSLVSDKHAPACQFQSMSPGAAVHWYGFHAARSQSEWCILLDVLLLKHLASCMATLTWLDFPPHHACARALSCCDPKLRTSHQTCGLPSD